MTINGDGESAGNAVERSLAYAAGLARRHDIADAVEVTMEGKQNGSLQDRVSGIFRDRVQAEKAIVRQLSNEIVLRDLIHKAAVREIDESLCQCENWLNEIWAIRKNSYVPDPEESLLFGSRRTALEQKILDLQSEKRAEESDAWRDVSTLRRYLLFSLRDYWSASRRSELLRWEPGSSNEAVSE